MIIGLLLFLLQDPNTELARLEKKLVIYRQERRKHQDNEFFRASKEHARGMAEEGLQGLRDFNALDAITKTFGATAGQRLDTLKKKAAGDQFLVEQLEREGHLLTHTAGIANEVDSIFGAFKKLSEDVEAGNPISARQLDELIVVVKLSKSAGYIPGYTSGRAADGIDLAHTLPLALLNLARAAKSPEHERAKYYEEAGNLGVGSLTTSLKLMNSQAAPYVAIGTVDAEVLSRLGYWAGAQLSANGQNSRASKIQNESIELLNYRILKTQFAIDRLRRKTRVPEPGGVKLSSLHADTLALRLDLQAIHYDPIDGRIILSGSRSEHFVDLEIFTTILKLAAEEHEPFFSLNPVNHEDWDSSSSRFANLLLRKYFPKNRSSNDAFTHRMTNVGKEVPGTPYFYAEADEFDPDLYAKSVAGKDVREQMVFSPEWLRHTRVGWILYEADLDIKAVASGLMLRGGKRVPLTGIDGFEPRWVHHHQTGVAGRANFELDETSRMIDGSSLDLSQVKPKLVMVHRTPGTDKDLDEACEGCEQITHHFSAHYKQYVGKIPSLAQMMVVFRAYVAARFLIKRHPGLAARIEALGRPDRMVSTPLYHLSTPVIRVRFEAGRLKPFWTDEERTLFHIGGGYGGGVTLDPGRSIESMVVPGSVDDWATTTFVPGAQTPRFARNGEQLGFVLELESPTVDPGKLEKLWILLFAGTALVALALFLIRLRFGGWAAHATICRHCISVHRVTESAGLACDVLAVACFLFLISLPFALAWEQVTPTREQSIGAVVGVGALLCLAALPVALAHAMIRSLFKARLHPPGLMRRLGSGARWGGLALVLALFWNGTGHRAVAGQIMHLLGTERGERLLLPLGPTQILVTVGYGLIATAIGALVIRWMIPFLRRSRPLMIATHLHP